MFSKGNKYGKGRPPYALKTPEILLPVIFAKGNLAWGKDLIHYYRKLRDDPTAITKEEKEHFKLLFDLLPFLITKISAKDMDLERMLSRESVQAAQNQTNELVKLLENENQSQSKT